MKVLNIADGLGEFRNGCWHDRIAVPQRVISEQSEEDWDFKTVVLNFDKNAYWLDFPDTVVFTRWYHKNVVKLMREYKRRGKKVVYELDDDVFHVDPVNPTKKIADAKKESVVEYLKEADIVTTTTNNLKELFEKKGAKNVMAIPNAPDPDNFGDHEDSFPKDKVRIGWSGSVTHWKDLLLVLEVIRDLQKELDFEFFVNGICAQPIASEFYDYQFMLGGNYSPHMNEFYEAGLQAKEILDQVDWQHIPFYPPELHTQVLSRMNIDIGICPLLDTKFNRNKSAMKFYQYAMVGAATLASDVPPYKGEVDFTTKNRYKDWKKNLRNLIVNEKMRKKVAQRQYNWVIQNRDMRKIAYKWEEAYKPDNNN